MNDYNICDATTIDVVGVDAVVVAAECNSWEKTSRQTNNLI